MKETRECKVFVQPIRHVNTSLVNIEENNSLRRKQTNGSAPSEYLDFSQTLEPLNNYVI